jgi:hypothetical protein
MGWAKGSGLFERLIEVLFDKVDDPDTREEIYVEMIAAFEDLDCDTLQECLGEDEAFDSALRLVYEERGETLD